LRFEKPLKPRIIAELPGLHTTHRQDATSRATRLSIRKRSFRTKSCIQFQGETMTETVVKLRLNQQQLELLDRTIAQGVAPDRVALVRLALHEYAAAHTTEGKTESAQ
jgi:hypothetical protein